MHKTQEEGAAEGALSYMWYVTLPYELIGGPQ